MCRLEMKGLQCQRGKFGFRFYGKDFFLFGMIHQTKIKRK